LLDIFPAIAQAESVDIPPILPVQMDVPKPRRKGRAKFIVIPVAVVLVVGAVMYFALRKTDPPVAVQTEKITRHTITETVIANGKIYPVVQVHISPEVSGEIIALPVREGQFVHKGDLLLKINPDVYIAGTNQAYAGYESSLAGQMTATANLEKAQTDYVRNKELFDRKLLSESDFTGFKAARDVAKAQLESAIDQVNVAKAGLDNAVDLLVKTTIVAPLDGTITTLNSQLGERVLGTVQNAGTDIMIISDLSAMEARVDIGEMDVVLVQAGQKANLEVDSYKDRKFSGVVSAVANSSEGLNAATGFGGGGGSSGSGQSATQFQVRIRILDNESFRPGMSVSATIETRTRTNAIAVPIAAVTTRVLAAKGKVAAGKTNAPPANAVAKADPQTNEVPATNSAAGSKAGKKEEGNKPVDVVFVVEGDHVKTAPVKIGIFDDDYYEITDGLKAGDEIVTGGYHAISHDLDDGKRITITKGVSGLVAGKDNL
jgi:HlyD family secretion protein